MKSSSNPTMGPVSKIFESKTTAPIADINDQSKTLKALLKIETPATKVCLPPPPESWKITKSEPNQSPANPFIPLQVMRKTVAATTSTDSKKAAHSSIKQVKNEVETSRPNILPQKQTSRRNHSQRKRLAAKFRQQE